MSVARTLACCQAVPRRASAIATRESRRSAIARHRNATCPEGRPSTHRPRSALQTPAVIGAEPWRHAARTRNLAVAALEEPPLRNRAMMYLRTISSSDWSLSPSDPDSLYSWLQSLESIDCIRSRRVRGPAPCGKFRGEWAESSAPTRASAVDLLRSARDEHLARTVRRPALRPDLGARTGLVASPAPRATAEAPHRRNARGSRRYAEMLAEVAEQVARE